MSSAALRCSCSADAGVLVECRAMKSCSASSVAAAYAAASARLKFHRSTRSESCHRTGWWMSIVIGTWAPPRGEPGSRDHVARLATGSVAKDKSSARLRALGSDGLCVGSPEFRAWRGDCS